MDIYALNIKTAQNCQLGVLEFQGATKKNKPNIRISSLIYARIVELNKHLPLQLSCKSKKNNKEWNSGEALFGELKGGLEIDIPVFFA